MSLPSPIATSGKIILLANILAKSDSGEKVAQLLSEIKIKSLSDSEPNTLTYRTTRGEGENSNTFVIFEEYVLPNGITEHLASPAFKALADSGLIASLDIKYFTEF